MEEEAVEILGVHHHQLGQDHFQVVMLQVSMYKMSVIERSGYGWSILEFMNMIDMNEVSVGVESGEAQTIEQVWKEYFADP